jgi:hypothetical protein
VNRKDYIDVDRLQAETTLEEAAAMCGAAIEVRGSGSEVRLDCPFHCPGDHGGKREISVNTDNPQKVFQCHAYQCGFRGNLLTLMHGWLTGQKPTGGKLKGAEFNRVKQVLAGKESPPTKTLGAAAPAGDAPEKPSKAAANLPLAESDNERARELTDINVKFKVNPAEMNPHAAGYVRRHPCLSPESMEKWRVGYLPRDGGGDKRGWSLRGHIIYPILSDRGKVLTWVGRDPLFEEKEQQFNALPPEQRGANKRPMKHRFPKGFHRGLELFGQHGSRLKEPGYRETIVRQGILIVEGFNDVIGLDNLGIPAVAICSNRITAPQVEKIAYWAGRLADGKVSLMFDCEPTGDEGAKEALWLLVQRSLDVRLAWSQAMHGGTFAGRQPESITQQEWDEVVRPGIER